jgi:hypothetical protein
MGGLYMEDIRSCWNMQGRKLWKSCRQMPGFVTVAFVIGYNTNASGSNPAAGHVIPGFPHRRI